MFDMIKNSSVGDYAPGTAGSVGHRQCYNSMVHYMDMVIGEIVTLLKSKNMYDDTVIFFQSDNGKLSWIFTKFYVYRVLFKSVLMARVRQTPADVKPDKRI
jgi:arylsulfatase A-like enzyme